MSVFALVEKLAPLIESEVKLVINSKQEAKILSTKLKKIQEGLQDAEREGVTNKSVKSWLKELEDVTYEMDDVLDEWAATNLQVEVQDTSLNWDKVRCLLDSLCLCFKQVWDRREITQKMKSLSKRIDTILTEKDKYNFTPSVNDRAQEFKQGPTTSLVSETYGIEAVKNRLVDKLVFEGEGSDEHTQIISIVGVGGVGKSTLARVAYNHPLVRGFFAPKGWVSVSQFFDPLVVGKAILGRFGVKSGDDDDLETVVQNIKEVVDNKRFLLVLDNVWTEDRDKWEDLRNSLVGGKGSRVVVTTRHESVARMMGTAQWESLGLLSDEDCGKILNGIALHGRKDEECEKLRGIGMKLAKKCNGLPLAARSVGSMLALMSTEREWRTVLESPLWKDEDKASGLFRLLNLSYLDLSPVLKRCLLSSVVFPKGSSLSIDEISRVWMAYGYLNSNGSVDEVQLRGFRYMDNLAMRSFFQRVASEDEYDDQKSYKMHDIMHDFATYLTESNAYSFTRDGGLEKEKSSSSSHNNLPDENSLGRLRNFSVCREELRPDIVSHLTSVRVLSMRDCSLQGLPEDIGKLIHLRYLNVSENPITELPETITDLCNLQTLDIQSCENLSSLPEGIGKLINLRHLLNTDTDELDEFPQGVGELSGLRTLSEFKGRNLGLLRNMNQLQGSLNLSVSIKEFGEPNLWEKKHIEKLSLEFYLLEEADELVEVLKPPPNLQTLFVEGKSSKWLCRWITSFDKLKQVHFYLNGCPDVPPFGKLPALEELEISGCSFKRMSIEFLGLEDANSSQVAARGFPRLKKLHFEFCADWEEWEDIEQESSLPVFTSLQELQIGSCWRLKRLPHNLLRKASSLRVVNIFSSKVLYARYNEDSVYHRDNIPLLPNQIWSVGE